MSRSVWKGPFVDFGLLRSVVKNQKKPSKDPLKIYSRRSLILPEFVGLEVEIHNGKNFQKLLVKEEMIGHYFGEFAPTRKLFVPKEKKKNKGKK
uniref:Small ribosomal subunit protein uS19c n=1 Tax=Chloropicon primus TaxID=1764295 RepID=A0A4D6C498_9CHLO|nr:ribosomal protein S19 [Chloropicon primus]QBX98470.1 ribosomal protein S19 [Chloropicon primus]